MISKGEKFPDFTLSDENGDDVSLNKLLESGPAVVFFYPKDNTRGCTKEACEFRDSYAVFNSMNASVVGISSDGKKSHQRFKSKHQLNFPILTDKGGALRKKAGIKSVLFGLVSDRVTFVIKQNGEVANVTNNQFDFTLHSKEAIQTLKKIL